MQLNRLFLTIGLWAPSVLSAPKPLSLGTTFIQAPREGTIDWNAPRDNSSFLAERDVHSEEWFNSRRKVRRGDDGVFAASKRGTPGNWQGLTGANSMVSFPTGVSWGGQRQDVFYHDIDGNVCSHFSFDGVSWSTEQDLGGSFDSSFGASCWGTGHIDTYGKGTDGGCWHNSFDSGRWGGWTSLGGNMVHEPSTVTWGVGRSDVFVISASDGSCWHKTYSGGAWSGWESLGGAISWAPASCSWGVGHMSIFVVGTDGQCWHRMWLTSKGGWSNWEALGGTITGTVTVVAYGTIIDLIVRGTDNHCWHRRYHGDLNRWEAWVDLGGNLAFAPNVVVYGTIVEIYIVQFDGFMYRRRYNGGWDSSWTSFGGSLGSQPSGVVWGSSNNNVNVFVMGTDHSCQRNF